MERSPVAAGTLPRCRIIAATLAVGLIAVVGWSLLSRGSDAHDDYVIDGSYRAVSGPEADLGMELTIRGRSDGRFVVRSRAGEVLADGHWEYGMYDTIRLGSSICPSPDILGEYLIRSAFPPDHPQELSLLNMNDTCEPLSRLLTVKTWEQLGANAG